MEHEKPERTTVETAGTDRPVGASEQRTGAQDTAGASPVPAPPAIAVGQAVGPTAPAGAPTSAAPVGTTAPSGAERLSIDEFMRLELRVARITAAERVPKSKKLIRMQVDVGTETRTLVAGIAEAYEPEALVGRTVVIVANLKPATLMGIESNGMVLAAAQEGGLPELVSFVSPPPPGTRVR